mgnify:CR=1 FL=1
MTLPEGHDTSTAVDDRSDILIVDDLPDKLLVFGALLEDLGQNLVYAHSGAEALRQVLQREFAVILLDAFFAVLFQELDI